jgi:hypothetical protein
MLAQDVFWSVVTIIVQVFNLIMTVFIALGVKVSMYSTAAVAVSFGCIYALDLILMFVLSFKHKAVAQSWDRSDDNLYGRLG